MGCKRDTAIDGQVQTIPSQQTKVANIPPEACEGHMSFLNTGTTNIAINVANKKPTITNGVLGSFYIFLQPGVAYNEEGIIAGDIFAVSDAAGGLLVTTISYSVKVTV